MIQTIDNYTCPNCGAIQDDRFVTESNITYKKCINCKHKELYSTLTTTGDTGEPMYIDMSKTQLPDKVFIF